MAKEHAGKYVVSRNLLWKDNDDHPSNIVDTPTGDTMAYVNGHGLCLASFIRSYPDSTELKINEHLKVIAIKEPDPESRLESEPAPEWV
jgi:hypothetical protein